MKNLIIKKIIPGILLIFGLFLLYHCQEDIISPNKKGSTVNLHITGNKLNICKGDTVVTKAPFAKFAFVSKNGTTLDTIFQGRLKADGEWDTIFSIDLGIPDVQVHGLLDLRSAVDSIHYLCCDDSFILNFKYDCNDVQEVKVNCDQLNSTNTLNLTNLVGGKILKGTTMEFIMGNTFQLDTSSHVIVNVNEAKALKGNFTLLSLSPEPAADGTIKVGPDTNPLVIKFSVNTNIAGPLTDSINLPVTCRDDLTKTGTIKIILKAEITEDACTCPFASNGNIDKELPLQSNSVILGTTSPVQSDNIFSTSELSLGDGCYLVIDSVVRYNSSVKATELKNAGVQVHEWKVDKNWPIELRNGTTTFSMSTTFTPIKVGESVDTFSVRVSVHNAAGEPKGTCEYLVSYSGDCCNNNICPSITKLTDLPADFINGVDGTVIRKLGIGEKIEMGSGNNIKQTMDGLMGTLCTSFQGENKIVSYLINIPEIDSIVPCSNVTISVEELTDGATDDRDYFSLINSSFSVKEGGNSSFGVQFRTPDVKTHISSGHSAYYKAKLIVRASDNSGEICSQQIDLEANVASKNYKISKSTNMKAFSQVSDKESSPSYAAYNIWKFNEEFQYYGQQDKLDPDKGTVNLNTNPPTPNTNHSFFFEVDEPTNLTLRQTPKLYLVSTPENKYSMVSSMPIARYNNNTDFTNDLDQLMQDVFNNNFQSRGNAPYTSFSFNSSANDIMWSPYVSAAQLAGAGNGLNIQLGEVYVIWNPIGTNETFDSGGKTYNNYCDVAFLYIEGLFDGTGSTNNIGNATFYVVYPLTTIIN
jgi:hypothetical protein